MKMRLLFLLLLSVSFAGCIKTLADEQGFYDPNFHVQPAGSSAKALLNDNVFKSLHIEVQYMPGARPTDATLTNLTKFLGKHLHKPGGITFTLTEIPAATDTIFSLKDIMEMEDRHRTRFTTTNEISVYVLFVDGYYGKPDLLGSAYRNTSTVLFGRHIQQNSEQFKKPSRTYLESRVLQHEFGHLLGLVNIGTEAQDDHHDKQHEKHCTNKYCLMYYLADTEDYPSVLIRQKPPELDADCIKDLKVNGGK
jgi:predicted Zn-dependent protease